MCYDHCQCDSTRCPRIFVDFGGRRPGGVLVAAAMAIRQFAYSSSVGKRRFWLDGPVVHRAGFAEIRTAPLSRHDSPDGRWWCRRSPTFELSLTIDLPPVFAFCPTTSFVRRNTLGAEVRVAPMIQRLLYLVLIRPTTFFIPSRLLRPGIAALLNSLMPSSQDHSGDTNSVLVTLPARARERRSADRAVPWDCRSDRTLAQSLSSLSPIRGDCAEVEEALIVAIKRQHKTEDREQASLTGDFVGCMGSSPGAVSTPRGPRDRSSPRRM